VESSVTNSLRRFWTLIVPISVSFGSGRGGHRLALGR
jgi:hypothetical protein